MRSMKPRAHAEALVKCFAGYVAKHDDLVNRENLRIASEWLRLFDSDEPSVAQIEALMKDLDALE